MDNSSNKIENYDYKVGNRLPSRRYRSGAKVCHTLCIPQTIILSKRMKIARDYNFLTASPLFLFRILIYVYFPARILYLLYIARGNDREKK